MAMEYNTWGPLSGKEEFRGINCFQMTQQGSPDNGDWVWQLELLDGTRHEAQGGCDFTGWYCQSYLKWGRCNG